MKRRHFFKPAVILIILLVAYCANVHAQSYRFQVEEVEFDVTVNKDASATLYYKIKFVNNEGAHVIDVVDVGLPTEKYDRKNMKAYLDGVEMRGIQVSQYVSPGVEVHLRRGIPAGETGVFEFEATIPELVFSDSTRKDYASFQITPTWFGAEFVEGLAKVTITVNLPEGLQPDEILYQNRPFTNKICESGHCTAIWEARYFFNQPYPVGVSFPQRVMDRVIVLTWWDLFKMWYEANRRLITFYVVIVYALIFLISMIRAFGSGGCIFAIMGAGLLLFLSVFISIWGSLLLSIGSLVLVEFLRRKRKKKYLPAIASVEGGGIKRGLTAPEAAILLEKKPEQIVAMVLFGLMKKGLIEQSSQKGKKPAFTVRGIATDDLVLHPYETDFLKLLEKKQKESAFKEARITEMSFDDRLNALGRQVGKKLKGFDVDETRRYYQHIVSRAWKEVQEGGLHPDESWQQKMDEKVDWLLLDSDFEDRFRPYRDVYIPRSYRSGGIGTGIPLPGPSVPSGGSGSSAPRFSDVAGSLAGWMENTSGALSSSLGISGPLHNMPIPSGGGGGSRSGGGGGGCACACAGCACACACAGGGR